MADDIQHVKISDLLLDPENPRLPESVERDQQSMLNYIAESTSIEELMEAIGENDYFPGEPLIAVPGNDGKFVVVEGNRRLTALKLLVDPHSCNEPGARMKEIAKEAQHRPKEVPVIVRPNRREVLPYLGYRHITGVKQWDPLAKARYIEQLFLLTNKELDPKKRYSEVARTIGSRRDHIKRNLDALAVYKIIKENDFYEIADLDDSSIKFSVLSTALADDRIGSFVGLNSKSTDGVYTVHDPIVSPAALSSEQIEELTRWIFERDKRGRTKVGESRNLRHLSAVVDNHRALAALRGGSLLKIAYQLTADLTKDFIELLYQAEASLAEASSMVATVDYEDDSIQVARRINDHIKMIGRELKDKRRPDDEDF